MNISSKHSQIIIKEQLSSIGPSLIIHTVKNSTQLL